MLLLVPVLFAEPVDRLLFAVGDRIVTAGDVAFDLDLDPYDQSPIRALEAPSYAGQQRVVDLTIVRALAGDTVTYRPTAAEVEARWLSVRSGWARSEAYGEFLARWGMDDEGLRGFLYSRLVCERYIRRVAGNGDVPIESDGFIPLYLTWIAEVRASVLVREAG